MSDRAVIVVGCGPWGLNHVRVLSALRGPDRVIAADPLPDRRAQAARLCPGVSVTDDWTRALDEGSDAVVIATPTEMHAAMARQALEANKHVLCEKPLCLTGREADMLVDLAVGRGLTLAVGFVFLFNPGLQAVRHLIQSHEIGDVLYCAAVRTNLGPIRRDVNAAYDLASHDIAIFNWLLDATPVTVSAVGRAFVQRDLEDAAFIALTYPRGIMAHVHASWLNPRKVRELTVVGSSKMVTWDDLNLRTPVAVYDKGAGAVEEADDYGRFLRLTMWEHDVRLLKIPAHEPLIEQDAAFLRSLSRPDPRLPDGRFGAAVTRVLEAVNCSMSLQGQPIDLAEAE